MLCSCTLFGLDSAIVVNICNIFGNTYKDRFLFLLQGKPILLVSLEAHCVKTLRLSLSCFCKKGSGLVSAAVALGIGRLPFRIVMLPAQSPLGARLGLGTPPHCSAPNDPWVETAAGGSD